QKTHMKALSDMNNDFAFRLYKSIVSVAQSENVFFSPLSVSMALSALSLGAGGETHEQLLSGLGFSDTVMTSEELHDAYLDLLRNLSQRTGVDLNVVPERFLLSPERVHSTSGTVIRRRSSVLTDEEMHQGFLDLLQNLNQRKEVDLSVGTAVYVHENFKPNPEFLEKLKRFYLSDGFSVDFTKSTETSNQINEYVSGKTHGKISKFIENLDPNTIMYLLSYVYFKGKWSVPFNPERTRERQFHVDKETTVPVQMMFVKDTFFSYHDHELSARVLRLDYNDTFSMILALPDENVTQLEEAVHPHHIAKWQKWMTESNIDVYLPKLSLKTKYNLNKILPGMGFRDMFTPKADFSGISDEKLLVSEAVHKATLDVDETGTEATAVTGIGIINLSARLPNELKFDRPFMIFIVDQKTNNVLFMGKIVNP
ncbi:hypothetical protein C0J50_11404, partial [Silurus asotus]